MKKTKINLLTSRSDYLQLEKIARIFRQVVIGLTVLVALGVGGVVFYQFHQNNKLQNLLSQKQALLTTIGQQKTEEAKLIYIAKKTKLYDQFILDDARSLPYFELLKSALKISTGSASSASSSASLSSFAIDKTRISSFTLSFPSVNSMIDSFAYIESSEFLQNFDSLSLSGLSISSSQAQSGISSSNQTTGNSLSFIGKFKPLTQ